MNLPQSPKTEGIDAARIRAAWQGRIAGWLIWRPTIAAALALAIPATALPQEASAQDTHLEHRSLYIAPRAAPAPRIDGSAGDPVWQLATWRNIDHRWLGPEYGADDFSGRYKVVWNEHRLFILFEFVDDILFDSHRDPLVQYWDDDCLEIFLDEDYSGGNHQYNHNAFAYHVSLDNQAVDIGTDGKARNYSDHVESRWRQHASGIAWEVAIKIYDEDYADDADNVPVELDAGRILGLMLAYCDNDGSDIRENFIGSEMVQEGAKDRGWIDAGLFGQLVLGQ